MSKLSKHLSEGRRLAALRQTGLLDTGDEPLFNEQVRLLAAMFQRPIAALSLVDRDLVHLKARNGVDFLQIERAGSFCGRVVDGRETLVVSDARLDSRFNDTDLVRDGGIRFYVGAPVEVFPGCCIGALCVLGLEPGEPTPLMLDTLGAMAAQLGHLVALRRELMLKDRIQTENLLAAGTLHEIKNSLTPAINYLELLLDQETPRSQGQGRQEWLRRASAALHDAVDLLRSVRFDHSDPERDAAREGGTFGEVVAGILRQASPVAVASGVTFRRTSREGDRVETVADGLELRQIVSNLVLNALDAMTHGGLLDVSTSLDEGTVVLEVSDEGAGMSAEELSRCFEPLFSTKRESGGAYGGCGIGLTVVRQIVRVLGGSIAVDSVEGCGTTFRVELPRSDRERRASDESSEEPRVDPLRVLVVDDEPMVLRSVGEVLESMGHEPTPFEDPRAALRRFQRVPDDFDVALVDLGMMPLDGLQLARRLRAVRNALPVIIASGNPLSGCDLPEGVVCIEKPYRMRQLREALERAHARA
ncbi:MAG: ATP-binding protein [Planctomycetota bacterium]|nr:ATP-binding protein [Planctomycetota bacterium]MDP6990512.1 ATP-binding protein [Planctomycetota bacterium]